MNIVKDGIPWLDLEVEQLGETFYGYEALTNESFKGDWNGLQNWIHRLAREIGEVED